MAIRCSASSTRAGTPSTERLFDERVVCRKELNRHALDHDSFLLFAISAGAQRFIDRRQGSQLICSRRKNDKDIEIKRPEPARYKK